MKLPWKPLLLMLVASPLAMAIVACGKCPCSGD